MSDPKHPPIFRTPAVLDCFKGFYEYYNYLSYHNQSMELEGRPECKKTDDYNEMMEYYEKFNRGEPVPRWPEVHPWEKKGIVVEE